jgi:hypothetical protein
MPAWNTDLRFIDTSGQIKVPAGVLVLRPSGHTIIGSGSSLIPERDLSQVLGDGGHRWAHIETSGITVYGSGFFAGTIAASGGINVGSPTTTQYINMFLGNILNAGTVQLNVLGATTGPNIAVIAPIDMQGFDLTRIDDFTASTINTWTTPRISSSSDWDFAFTGDLYNIVDLYTNRIFNHDTIRTARLNVSGVTNLVGQTNANAILMSGVLDMNNHDITNVTNMDFIPGGTLNLNISSIIGVSSITTDGLTIGSGPLDMNGGRLINVPWPEASGHAVPKIYVDTRTSMDIFRPSGEILFYDDFMFVSGTRMP